MKIFLPVQDNGNLEARIDSKFGRAAYFLIYDTDKKQILSVEENQYKHQGHGVGLAVCNHIIQTGCQVAIGAQPGPKADKILVEGNITFHRAENCTAKEALENHKYI